MIRFFAASFQRLAMNDIEFAALLVSRVCHDLVSPVGAVINGLEVLEDETDAAMRADALRLVAASAGQAAARLQFARLAFGAAGSAGAELDLAEVARIVEGLLKGGKIELVWQPYALNWPKDWAKLLMNTVIVAADCLPRGGRVVVETASNPATPGFTVTATGTVARLTADAEHALLGEPGSGLDGRSIQPYLTFQLSRLLNAGLASTSADGMVRFVAG
jgi:histidine phosphotransferase ChpT